MSRLLLLHGFTQTATSFDPLCAALSSASSTEGIDTETLDLPGHGSDRPVTGDLWAAAGDLVAAGHRGRWLGYSMGARLALHVALAHPEAVDGLVLIGGTAGIDDDAERTARRDHDHALADRIEHIGVEAFLDEWLALDLFATLPADPDRKARRATNPAAGLAASLRRWGTATMDPPLWPRLAEIHAPTLVLAGSLDPKFTELGWRLAVSIGANARFTAVEDAGHAAHLERPDVVARLVAEWLNATRDPGRTAGR